MPPPPPPHNSDLCKLLQQSGVVFLTQSHSPVGALVLSRAFDFVHDREPRLRTYFVRRVRFLHTPASVRASLSDALEHILERLKSAWRDTFPVLSS